MHNIVDLIGCGEALVHEIVLIVDKVLVLAELVFLSTEEFVDLGQP